MRTRFTSKSKSIEILEKLKSLVSEKKTCIQLEVGGKRYFGQDFTSCTISNEGIAFSIGGDSHFLALEDIDFVKRLRTKRFCFYAKSFSNQSEKEVESSSEVEETKTKSKSKNKKKQSEE